MFVAASTLCFESCSLEEAVRQLAELEFVRVEIFVSETGQHLKPSEILNNFEGSLRRIRNASPLEPVSFFVDLNGLSTGLEQTFRQICRFSKQAMVPPITMQASPIGTPFNTEIDRLKQLCNISTNEGILLSIKTEVDRLTRDPDTAVELCQAVPGLGLTLDPSHYIFGCGRTLSFDQVLPHVSHVHLRDTSPDHFQTRIGQGEIEYGRLITQLDRFDYRRALSVEILERSDNDFEREPELRKLRLLLESLV